MILQTCCCAFLSSSKGSCGNIDLLIHFQRVGHVQIMSNHKIVWSFAIAATIVCIFVAFNLFSTQQFWNGTPDNFLDPINYNQLYHSTNCSENTELDWVFKSFDTHGSKFKQNFIFDEFENINTTEAAYHKLRTAIFSKISVNNHITPNCLHNLPLFVNYGSHHKTGSQFSRLIFESIAKYCHINISTHIFSQTTRIGNDKNKNKHENPVFMKYFGKSPHWPLSLPNIEFISRNYKQNLILLHFIRSPLNTIISGFNFHAQCWPEAWLKCQLEKECNYQSLRRWSSNSLAQHRNVSGSNDIRGPFSPYRFKINHHNAKTGLNYYSCLNSSYYHTFDSTAQKMKKIGYWGTPLLNVNDDYIGDHTYNRVIDCYTSGGMIKARTIDKVFIDKKQSVCTLYKDETISMAERLYFEFIRYLNCEFEEIYASYLIIKNYKHGYNFRMENYTQSSKKFDQFVHKLMVDVLKLKFNSTNSKEYKTMIKIMRDNDVNRWSEQRINENAHVVSKHATPQGHSSSTDKQKELLMSFQYTADDVVVDVCQIIKDMTQRLDYEWKAQLQTNCKTLQNYSNV